MGKSSFIQRVVENKFNYSMVSTTSNNDFKLFDMKIDNQVFNLKLWDTAGLRKIQIHNKSKLLICKRNIFIN